MSKDNFYTGSKISDNNFAEKILSKLKRINNQEENEKRFSRVILVKKKIDGKKVK